MSEAEALISVVVGVIACFVAFLVIGGDIVGSFCAASVVGLVGCGRTVWWMLSRGRVELLSPVSVFLGCLAFGLGGFLIYHRELFLRRLVFSVGVLILVAFAGIVLRYASYLLLDSGYYFATWSQFVSVFTATKSPGVLADVVGWAVYAVSSVFGALAALASMAIGIGDGRRLVRMADGAVVEEV